MNRQTLAEATSLHDGPVPTYLMEEIASACVCGPQRPSPALTTLCRGRRDQGERARRREGRRLPRRPPQQDQPERQAQGAAAHLGAWLAGWLAGWMDGWMALCASFSLTKAGAATGAVLHPRGRPRVRVCGARGRAGDRCLPPYAVWIAVAQ